MPINADDMRLHAGGESQRSAAFRQNAAFDPAPLSRRNITHGKITGASGE
jgi:hypothetical protein